MQLDNLFEVIKTAGQKPFSSFVNRYISSSVIGNNSYADLNRKGFVFNQFKNLESAFDKKNEIKSKITKKSYENSALSFVSSSIFDNYKSFINHLNSPKPAFTKIKEISSKFIENVKTLINLGGLYKNDRIIITEDTRGVFDFGLASLGLYRPIEFYSQKLADDINNGNFKNPFLSLKLENGVVNGDDIKKQVIGNVKIFSYLFDGKKYDCERRQKGATKVFNIFFEECYLKPDKDGLFITYYLNNKDKVFNGKGDVKLKYASSNKKSYLIYNKKDDSVKNVDIFMPVNFLTSTVKDGGRAVALLPAYLIAATLEEFGIQSRISALRIGSDNETQITVSIPVKDYQESTQEAFDRTFALLSLSSSADSFFAFHKVIAENEGIQAPATKDTGSNFDEVKYFLQDYMDDIMQRYKNWSEANKDKDFINTKVVNPNFQFALATLGSSSMPSDLDYKDILEELHGIFFTFYYYMDFLAIEMLDMREFVKSVFTRFTEDVTFRKIYSMPSTNAEIKTLMRSYILTMLVQKYKLVPSGAYADTLEQKQKKEETFQKKVISLNEEINNL
jgi:hypothetical protein